MYGQEEKQYSIIGKVEIGTDEYRDLIEAKMNLEKDLSEERSRRWNAENAKDRLNKVTVNQKKQIDNYTEFLKEKELTKEFDLWVYKKELDEKSKQSEETEY